MRHIFIVNPHAGGRDNTPYIKQLVQSMDVGAEVYVTRGPRDAVAYVADRLRQDGDEPVRLYACGGDGTLNEVVSGVMEAQSGARGAECGQRQVEVGCYPCGSGNDYIKCWPGVDFADLRALFGAPSQPVDVMRVGDRYCVNVLNYGFEAEVCRTMEHVRRWPLLGGRMAYVTGIVHCLLHKRHNPCRISVDGEAWHSGDMLLGSAANGRFVGGGYQCAPRAVVDDGWLEAQCVDVLSIPRFLRLIGSYRRGEHLDRVDMHDVVHHRRVHSMCFEADRDFSVVTDGELLTGRRFEITILPKAVNFIVPEK